MDTEGSLKEEKISQKDKEIFTDDRIALGCVLWTTFLTFSLATYSVAVFHQFTL